MPLKQTTRPLLMGAVAYDPKVVTIWDGFIDYFAKHDFAFDYVLYSNYERMVEAHLRGDIDAAWNSPLAWLEAEAAGAVRARHAKALVMRDTDCGLTSVVVVRADSPVKTLADLRGRIVAVGASDSPQATLIPLGALAEAGLEPGRDVEVLRFDVMVGKHGDHVGGERDAARAMLDGRAEAACMIDGNHLAFGRDGLWASGQTRVIYQTGPYDHCNMTIFDDTSPARVARFSELLLAMSYDDPTVRPLLDLEGLKRWVPGRTTGYAALARATDRFATIAGWLERQRP